MKIIIYSLFSQVPELHTNLMIDSFIYSFSCFFVEYFFN